MSQALISVSNKDKLVPFAKKLAEWEIEIISTGGTNNLLKESNLKTIAVSKVTNFPEVMDGRVKTLHHKIHAGILSRREKDAVTLAKYNIQLIDWVIVNLYPFSDVINRPEHDFDEAIENIDIGGPSMLRAAAKNHQYVIVIADPNDYEWIIDEYEKDQTISANSRLKLAQKAFQHCANYDKNIARWMLKHSTSQQDNLASYLQINYPLNKQLRYGENPHQQAAFYTDPKSATASMAHAKLLQGKELSYNNIVDADACLECLKQVGEGEDCCCVIVKHNSPCGVAVANSPLEAYQLAYQVDSSSAFGGVIATNHLLDKSTVEKILNTQFLEILIAPDFSADTLDILKYKPTIRVLKYLPQQLTIPENRMVIRQVNGGLLCQQADTPDLVTNLPAWQIVGKCGIDKQTIQDINFSWKLVKLVKSNAIVFAKNKQSLGIGGGQTSRVFATEIAVLKALKAGLSLNGSVMSSDAFLPFADVVNIAAENGIKAIIQPGGSIRDKEVIAAADKHNIAMLFTHTRHFYH